MKTNKTYIAICTLLLTFTGALAQNAEGTNLTSINNYEVRKSNNTDTNNVTQLQDNRGSNREVNNRIAAAELINYQAVARDAGGNLMVNTAVTIDFEIRNGAGGTPVFNETHNINTDANGVFSAQIGSISPLINVNWLQIDPWLQVTMDGTDVGETAIASVPTSLHSKQSGAVMIYGSGTSNADKMIAQHSPAFPGWGIGYSDLTDNVDFMAGGTKNLSIALGSGDVSTQGNIEVNETTTSPALNTVYGNSMPIAYGSVALGFNDIQTGYGITSFSNPAVGEYDIVLDHNTDMNNCIVLITPFTGSFGTPEIAGYEPTGPNSFTVRIQTAGGVARDSAFTFVVYGNQ